MMAFMAVLVMVTILKDGNDSTGDNTDSNVSNSSNTDAQIIMIAINLFRALIYSLH